MQVDTDYLKAMNVIRAVLGYPQETAIMTRSDIIKRRHEADLLHSYAMYPYPEHAVRFNNLHTRRPPAKGYIGYAG